MIEDYRKSLHDVKRSDEVGDVFIEFALKFLEKVLEDFKPEEYTEDIAFEPEKESYTLSERLKERIGRIFSRRAIFLLFFSDSVRWQRTGGNSSKPTRKRQISSRDPATR